MRFFRLVLLSVFVLSLTTLGAACQKKTERKITVEGPEKKHEIKLETTEKKD